MPIQVQKDLPTFTARTTHRTRTCQGCGDLLPVTEFAQVFRKGLRTDRRLTVCRGCVRRYITGIKAGASPVPPARRRELVEALFDPVAQAAVDRARSLAVEEGWTIVDADAYDAFVPPGGLTEEMPRAFTLRGVPTSEQWRSKVDELRRYGWWGRRLAALIEGDEPTEADREPDEPEAKPEPLGPDPRLVKAFARRYDLDLAPLFDAFALGDAAACDTFLRHLVGRAPEASAAGELARRLDRRLSAPPEERRDDQFYAALTVKAYNHHRQGTVPELLAYMAGIEPFPQVAGAA